MTGRLAALVTQTPSIAVPLQAIPDRVQNGQSLTSNIVIHYLRASFKA
jgi:hypothetical protein